MVRKATKRRGTRPTTKTAPPRATKRKRKPARPRRRATAAHRALPVPSDVRALSAAERSRLRKWAYDQIDAFMRKQGLDPTESADPDGWRWFELGSAMGFALVGEIDGDLYLQVAAEVMPLPADRDLVVPLMRELLEFNTNIWGSARFGLRNRRVYACVSARVADLDAADFGTFINEVMALSDAVDDELKKKYGGTTKGRS